MDSERDRGRTYAFDTFPIVMTTIAIRLNETVEQKTKHNTQASHVSLFTNTTTDTSSISELPPKAILMYQEYTTFFK